MSLKTKKVIFITLSIVILLCLGMGIHFLFFLPVQPANFLVLGIAGKGYTGEDLTDSVLFTSLNNQTGKTLVLSLPRDIWIPSLRTKLNSIYHYQGLSETKKLVADILGQPIDYGVVIDFEVFKKIVDILSGVEVTVERSFDDYKYPLAGRENDLCNGDLEYKCRYEHVHFDAGKQIMDGQTALKYVRSRNAQGEEGTDFARAQRQQRLLLAIKNRILSPAFLFNPRKSLQLFKMVASNIQTDIPKEKYLLLFKTALRFKSKNLKMIVLNDGYLINPPTSKVKYDNQWVLIPKSGNWEEVQKYVVTLLKVP